LFEFKLKEGNSLQHTLYKLGETVVGFVLAAFIHIFSSVIRFLP
jgi:urate oxidase